MTQETSQGSVEKQPPSLSGPPAPNPTVGATTPSVPDEQAIQDLQSYGKFVRNRFWVGVCLAAVGIIGVGIIVWKSFADLAFGVSKEALAPQVMKVGESVVERAAVPTSIVIAVAVAHAVIAIAGVYFCYQLLKAAERLFIPAKTLNEGKVEHIRAILGIQEPSQEAVKQLDGVVGVVTKALDETSKSVVRVADAATSVVKAAGDKK